MKKCLTSALLVMLLTLHLGCSTRQTSTRPFTLLLADPTNVNVDLIHFQEGDMVGSVKAPQSGYALTTNAVHKLQQAGWMP